MVGSIVSRMGESSGGLEVEGLAESRSGVMFSVTASSGRWFEVESAEASSEEEGNSGQVRLL